MKPLLPSSFVSSHAWASHFKALIFFFLFFNWSVARSQTTFQKTYSNGSSLSVVPTSDGGFISVGSANNAGTAGDDIYLVKTDAAGVLMWSKYYGGSGEDKGECVKQTSDGGFIITGSTNSTGAGNKDMFLLKTDSLGNTSWFKTYGGTRYDDAHSVITDTQGGFIICGETTSFGNFGGTDSLMFDGYIVKTDSAGNLLWTKILGGTSHDYINQAIEATNSDLIILGETYSFGAGGYDVYMTRTDSLGAPLWSKTYGRSDHDLGYGMTETTDGGIAIAGQARDSVTGGYDLYLLKTDASGILAWSKTMSVIGNSAGNAASWSDTRFVSIQQTASNGFVMAGSRDTISGPGHDLCLVKTDSAGNILFSKIYNEGGGYSSHQATSLSICNDGSLVLAGINYSAFNIIKTDNAGLSHCREFDALTTVTAPVTLTANAATQVASGGTTTSATITETAAVTIITDDCLGTGINELTLQQNAYAYPNPATTTVVIKLEGFQQLPVHFALYDDTGKKIKEITGISASEIALNVEQLSNGIYFYSVTGSTQNVICKGKLVIAH